MKTISFVFILFWCNILCADMPGNKPRPSFDIHLSGLSENPDYTFYSRMEYDDSASVLKDSSSIYVPGGYGTPAMIFIWAKNNHTKETTDSLFFSGGEYSYNPSFKLSIQDNHLQKEQLESVPDTKNTSEDIKSEQEINEENWKWRNITSTLVILFSVAFTFFIYQFYTRKKNQKK